MSTIVFSLSSLGRILKCYICFSGRRGQGHDTRGRFVWEKERLGADVD